MRAENPDSDLSKNLKGILNSLCALYASKGPEVLQDVVMNSDIRVHENWTSDNAPYPRYGHTLQAIIPGNLYKRIGEDKIDLQNRMRDDFNNIYVSSEFIAEVFFESEHAPETNRHEEAGIARFGNKLIFPDALKRIWIPECYKVFLSHKNEVKKEANTLRDKLSAYGVSSFVAHVDIQPTREWQDEIELALSSMDCLVALLTEKFHDSPWTDQEIGFALGRGVPVIPVRLGKDPYGFIGKLQAITSSWETAPSEIAQILMKQTLMLDSYINAVKNCQSFEDGDALARLLPAIDRINQKQIVDLIKAFNEYGNIRRTFNIQGAKPRFFEENVATQLDRLKENAKKL